MSNLTDQELIYAFARGTTAHHHTKVVMRGKRFVIFHIPGHKYWSSMMVPSAYAPSQHILIPQGVWMLSCTPCFKKEWEGRVSKKELQQALEEAEKGEQS